MEILGRDVLLRDLWKRAIEGQMALLHGPVGIGKTAILLELQKNARSEARPCGFSRRTEALADVTSALLEAYPECGSVESQRRIRSRLRNAIEERPGILLLDGLVDAGSAMKGFLRSIRATGLGIVMAADVEHPRDRARMRSLHLTHREFEVPPLHAAHLKNILLRAVDGQTLPRALEPELVKKLVASSRGRPGWIRSFAARLTDWRYWSSEGLRLVSLQNDVIVETAERYLKL